MKRIVVSGGTGYIGTALVAALVARGDQVTVLTRGGAAEGNPRRVTWNPYELGDWAKALDGVDAVVNLVGEQAVGVRYTKGRKRRIRDSRVIPTENIVRALATASVKPTVLVSASGSNYYGAHPADVRVDESFGPGRDFLARVCIEWEAASEKARDLGIRVVNPRLAAVLSYSGGSLPTMALPFRLFIGGRLGSGTQGFSWIHLDDAIAALLLCIDDDTLPAKVNVCSPNPVTNLEVSRALAKALHRPCWFPVPAFVLKLLFGEGAEPILTGQCTVPAALLAQGWNLRYSSLDGAVVPALGPG